MVRVPGLALLWLVLMLGLGCRTVHDKPTTVVDPSPGTADLAAPTPDFAPLAALDGDADGLFAYTDPGQLPRLLVAKADNEDGEPSALPLQHTDVDARVRGHVARVRVTQEFHNDRAHAIEVIYTFPLPENSAVDDMRMVIGEHVIESEVQTRSQARKTYENARSEGPSDCLGPRVRPTSTTSCSPSASSTASRPAAGR